jgi:TonB family protein
MKALTLGFLVVALHVNLQAQVRTLHYNSVWEIVPQDQAVYYRTCRIGTGMGKTFFLSEVQDFTIDGKLIMQGQYTDAGVKDGEFTFYYRSGQIQAKGNFSEGVRTGTWKYFFKNGQLEREVIFPKPERNKPSPEDFIPVSVYDSIGTAILTNGTGNWHFEYEWYGVTERYIVEGRFLGGKKEGIWTCRLSSGQLLYQETYKNNKLKEGFVSDGRNQEAITEPINNKFMLSFKFEVTEGFVYKLGTDQKSYPFLSFLPKDVETLKTKGTPDSLSFDAGDEDKVFIAVEQQAEFPGGPSAMYKFILKNLKYPASARRMGVEGRVNVQFIVERDGSIANITVVKGINADLDKEAVRIVSSFPTWTPGMQGGRPVKSQFVLPIPFKLD